MEGQVSIFDQDIWCGKMSAEASQVPEKTEQEKTSELSWRSWQGLSKKKSQFLDLRRVNGVPQESSSEMGGALLGGSQMPNIGEFLNVEEGLRSLLTSTDTMHLALFLENTNPTEAPCEYIPSHLSDILEENPDPKYTLSSKACLGILNRASRRGKTLPLMLEAALIQTVVGETKYGQEGIADTIEILRKMRCEIGEEALKEWVQRTFVLVQSEEVLLGEVCEPCEDSEDSNEQVMVEGDSEEDNREEGMCDLQSNGEIGDTPQRREPDEQLCRELDLLMQKLPHENAPKAVIMFCLRIACEGEESLPEALPTVSQADDIFCIDGDKLNKQERKGGSGIGYREGDKQYTLTAKDVHGVAYTMQDREGKAGGGKGALIAKDLSATLRAGFAQTLFQPVFSVENHPADSRVDIDESGKVQTLTSRMGTGGGNVPMVMEAYQHHGYRESEVLGTLTAGQNGGVRGDTPLVLDKVVDTSDGDIAGTLDASYYKGCGLRQGRERTFVVSKDVAAVDCRNCTENSETNGTLQSHMSGGSSLNLNNVVRTKYIVRRLTPLECERLQGYPDGWTDIGEWTDSNGKVHKTSDAARYKALGNSIALPPWKWVLKRLCACYERDATLASLFDGIGGFPLIWEQLNGKGSCLWASEVESFCIAVTEKRFNHE